MGLISGFSVLSLLVLHPFAQAQEGTFASSWLQNLEAFPNLSKFTTFWRSQGIAFYDFNATDGATILAPTDDAVTQFLNSPAGASLNTDSNFVQAFLAYHVVEGLYLNYAPKASFDPFIATYLTSGSYANVTGGQRIHALWDGANGTVYSGLLQNATVYNRTLYDGGEIYISDSVFTFPQSMSSTAIALNLTSFVGAVSDVGIQNTLDNTQDVTLLVPDNDAFKSVAGNLANLTSTQLVDVLSYHAILSSKVLYSSDLTNGLIIPTQNGKNLTVSNVSGAIYFNSARVVVPDVLIRNGVIHVVDQVLNPGNVNSKPDQQAFADPMSASNVPFTSGVPTPTSAIPLAAAGAQSTSSSSSSSAASSSTSSSNTGAIAGGVVGGVVGLAAVAFLFWFIRRRRSKRHSQTDAPLKAGGASGDINRNGTTKSFYKAELESTTKAYQKAELEASNGDAHGAPTKVPKAFAAPAEVDASATVQRIRSELSGTASSNTPAETGAVASSGSQRSPSSQADKNIPSVTQLQQQEQKTPAKSIDAQEAQLAELRLQQKQAEQEHQKRMAELRERQRIAEEEFSAARLRSRDQTVSELEAATQPRSPEN